MDKDKMFESLDELSKVMKEASSEREQECDHYWNALSEEDREKAFYSVIKRMYKAEVQDRGSYRWALYDVFGFDHNMYIDGMDCGYMAMHNMIFDGREYAHFNAITRLEVIDNTGRAYTKYFDEGAVKYSLQDDNRTLKIFIEKEDENEYQTQFDF